MTSLLARAGHHETRALSQAVWRPGKRKRQEWVCRECRARPSVGKQTRRYSDDARIAVGDYLWQPRDSERAEDDHQSTPIRREWVGLGRGKAQTTQKGRWAPDSDSDRGRHGNAVGEVDDGPSSGSHETTDRVASHERAQSELWERFEQIEDRGDELSEADANAAADAAQYFSVDERHLHNARNDALLDIDYAALLSGALEKREIDLTFRCLFAAARADDVTFIRSLSEETFSGILRVLEPANSIDELASAHMEISSAVRKQFGIASMHKVAYEYLQVVKEIVRMRRSGGIYLTLADYKVLLRSARDLGNLNLSKQLWKLLHVDGHTPDTECYNYHMAGRLLSGVHDASGRHKLRVIRFHMLARSVVRLGQGFQGYRIGLEGIKPRIMAVFRDMLRNGAAADEESFRIVITAAARQGDLATVKSVLRKVWNIDVDALLAGTDEREIQPKQLPADSPLRPTERMLFTIAHAFGINNDIPTALRLVDFVARQYELVISLETWGQLFEWTFVLSTPRTGVKSKTDGSRTGQLPLQSVMNLWDTMTGAPYHIQPTMGMYNHLIKNLSHRDMTSAMMEKMEEGRQLYAENRYKATKAWRELENGIIESKKQQGQLASPASTQSLEHLRRTWEHADLIRKRNMFWLKRWLALLLRTVKSTSTHRFSHESVTVQIPHILYGWRKLASTHVRYETAGGIVEFDIRSQEEIDRGAVWKASNRERQEEWLSQVPKYVGGEWLRSEMPLLPKRLWGSPEVERFLEEQSNGSKGATDDAQQQGRETEDEAVAEATNHEAEDLRREVKEAVDVALNRS